MPDQVKGPGARWRRGWGGAVTALALMTLLAAFAGGRAVAAPTDDECLTCHKMATLARDVGREGSLTVEAGALQHSAHARLACVRCHKDATSAKHPPRLAKVRCVDCHVRERDRLATSAHAGIAGGDAERACIDCHGGAHRVQSARGRSMCARCHPKETRDYDSSVHGVARTKGDMDASTCSDCHGSGHDIVPTSDPRSKVGRDSLTTTCARCHANRQLMTKRHITIPDAVAAVREQRARAVHQVERRALQRLPRVASHPARRRPDVVDLPHEHPDHVRALPQEGSRGLRDGRPRHRARTRRDRVAGLHRLPRRAPHPRPARPELAGRVGADHEDLLALPRGRPASARRSGCRRDGCPRYQDSFHGLAARGGSPAVANCASCHGFHDILPSSDPRSMVSPAAPRGDLREVPPRRRHALPDRAGARRDGDAEPAAALLDAHHLPDADHGHDRLHGAAQRARLRAQDRPRACAAHLGHAAAHAHAAERWFERMNVAERAAARPARDQLLHARLHGLRAQVPRDLAVLVDRPDRGRLRVAQRRPPRRRGRHDRRVAASTSAT